jgi:hypothetical protein
MVGWPAGSRYWFDDAIKRAIWCTRVKTELVHDAADVAGDCALGQGR